MCIYRLPRHEYLAQARRQGPAPRYPLKLRAPRTAGRPTVTDGGRTLTYNLMRGKLTESGEEVVAGFYTALGDNEFGCVSASFTLP
jgi:hypothetical protein